MCGAPLLLSAAALIAFFIKLDSSGPTLYRQERIGRNGKRFQALKFRTMIVDAEAELAVCFARDENLRLEWELNHKLKNDPRLTRVGAFLRKTSLDELPQLWNVLAGDMSLVGPRPIVAAEMEKYGRVFEDYARVRPGLTGLWQVSGRNDTDYERRIRLDRYYVRNWSVWFDIWILAKTVPVVLLGKGAY
jgi:Undecaprenyl-phosphate galactose phosphotransferase WbaP